jgi:anti-sigma factor RsiW
VTHVAFGTLVDYVRGLGSTAARERVRDHLSRCAHCQQTAGGLTRLAELAAADIDCEVPDDVVDEAPHRAADERRHSGAPRQPRFLRFAPPGGAIDVHLLVIEETGMVLVSGQIVARKAGEPVDLEVSAHRAPNPDAIGRTRATPGGHFQLRYDAPATAVLRFVNPAATESIDVAIDEEA